MTYLYEVSIQYEGKKEEQFTLKSLWHPLTFDTIVQSAITEIFNDEFYFSEHIFINAAYTSLFDSKLLSNAKIKIS